MRLLMSFLGTEDYQETGYVLSATGTPPIRTSYVAAALFALTRPHRVCVIGTEEARAKHLEQLADAIHRVVPDAAPAVDFVLVPHGRCEREQWEQFDRMLEYLTRLCRRTSDLELIADITHGFRAQPFFMAGVLLLMRLVSASGYRLRTSVYYAAFDANNRDRTPIWDLTAINETFDWAIDIATFLRTGYLGKTAERGERLGNGVRKEWWARGKQGPEPKIRDFARAVERFATDLTALRLRNLVVGADDRPSSAAQLAQELEHLDSGLPQLAPLRAVRSWLEETVRPLAAPSLYGPDGQRALAALARLYLRLHRYLEAAAVLREALVLRHYPTEHPRASDHFDPSFYRVAERLALGEQKEHEVPIDDLRNDLLHGGLIPSPRPATRLVQELQQRVEEFASSTTQTYFANISNHPIEKWTSAQQRAAMAIADVLYDIPFPRVPPDADLSEIKRIAQNTLSQLRPGTIAAMVMGEYRLVCYLVPLLQALGVRAYAATTERVVRERDGRKESEFIFHGFHPYPLLKLDEPALPRPNTEPSTS